MDGRIILGKIFSPSSAYRLRWSIIPLGRDFDVEYGSTDTEFGQGDCLSRLIYKQKCSDEEALIAGVTVKDDREYQLAISYNAIDGAIVYLRLLWW